MQRLRRSLPSLERWLRPTAAAPSAAVLQPGRFLVGPEPKQGEEGRTLGRRGALMGSPAAERSSESVGSAASAGTCAGSEAMRTFLTPGRALISARASGDSAWSMVSTPRLQG